MTPTQRYRWIYKPLVWSACLAPLALIGAGLAGFGSTSLAADPVRETLHRLGRTALNLLLITLAITPLRELLHWPELLRLRRLLGLFAFSYALLHFLVYASLDWRLDLERLAAELVQRPYITVGFAALLALVPLAATSTGSAMRRLGRRWQHLHYLIYPATVLAVWHFAWQVKADWTEPTLYAGALALLLGYRVYRRRRRLTSTCAPATAPEKTSDRAPSPGS
ncbi:MAG: sulfoxide reductase heme-binding subunit YedZ [Steroidobacteraceae bacterium]|nr:sulfoxide reductase heme-binding subunit YedZ [Steroidobacteraceae bacterium]MDW8260438.1 protein-methionine-sulfoxide reductase heme-binding subunit MsrQ [Gammaproteobacteria bacterium]